MTKVIVGKSGRRKLTLAEMLSVAHPHDPLWDRIRARQMSATHNFLPLITATVVIYAVYIFASFSEAVSVVPLGIWFAAVLASTTGVALMVFDRKRKDVSTRRMDVGAVWRQAAWSAAVALPWAVPPLFLLPLASPEQMLTVMLITTAMMAITSAVFFSMPLAGLVHLAVVGLGGTVAMWLSDSLINAVILATLAISMGVGFIEHSRLFLARLLDELEIEDKNATITLLLREYEEAEGDWLWQTDSEGRLVHLTDRMAQMLSREADDLIGRHFVTLVAGGDDEAAMRPLGLKTLALHVEARTAFSDLVVPVIIGEETRWWQLAANPIEDEDGRHVGFRGVGSDVTEARISEDKINRMARYDALTGLPNRSLLMESLEEALSRAQRLKRSCALLFIDLDRFKSINDTLGHQIGDKLLTEVAHRLEAAIGEGERLGRLGGDEFAVVVREVGDERDISEHAARLIETLSEPYQIDGHKLSIGASIGLAFGPGDGSTTHNLIRSADLALYRAKDEGRGVARRYKSEMHREAEERRQLETELRSALKNGELALAYQPILSAGSQKIEGFEALLRWTHPALGEVPPDKFVPIAEEAGLIATIGEWVIRTACAEAVKWPDNIRIAINLSPVQFNNPNLTSVVLSSLSKSGLSPARLELEITEGVFLAENAHTMAVLHQLQSIGVRIALDDFGTGYSSLGYLRKAAFSKIKIDQSFVRGAARDSEESVAIIKAIVALADSLDIQTTAEGAETEAEYESIRTLGCGQVQGFYFSHPMTPAQALALVSDPDAETELHRRFG